MYRRSSAFGGLALHGEDSIEGHMLHSVYTSARFLGASFLRAYIHRAAVVNIAAWEASLELMEELRPHMHRRPDE
jgi:N-formylglutamate amidohydrolase